ncbi:hypothetical protein WME79_31195 [Sorangium sp. So ce726]|uniref:hypothetical protein n=1 Tax=Sorangium sp. So ce726 TaxID=3133319 RepID=UPI003F62D4CD
MKQLSWNSALLLCLLLAGCKDGSAASEGAPTSGPTQARPVADTEIAVPADYEESAATEITTDNYKKALDDIEGELKR